jgi:STE24 endopeptidase
MSEAAAAVLDEGRQQKAREYARLNRRLLLVDLALGGAYMALWLATGWNIALREWVDTITRSPALAVLIYALTFSAPYGVVELPLSYYGGFVLPHRYGQSTQTLRGWITDQIKGAAISVPLSILVLEIVYALLRAAPEWWWLYAAVVMLFFTVVLSVLAPVIIAPLFYKFTPLADEDLARRLLDLAVRAGTEVKGVFRIDMSRRTKSANAAVMGLGATRRIVLGDTLLDEFTPDEIETILAHELAHLVHRDVPLLVASNSLLTLASFGVAHLVLQWGARAFGLQGLADPAGMPVFALTLGAIGLIAMPLGNAFSRWRERMADRYALEMTRKPEAFASAMTRLANQNLGEADPERWVVILLYSHPPIIERVAAAQAFATAQAD